MPFSPPRPLSRAEREERADDARTQEKRLLAGVTGRIADALRESVVARAVIDEVTAEVPATLAPAFHETAEHAALDLVDQLTELGLDADIDRLVDTYHRQMAAWEHAIRHFTPAVALHPRDVAALVDALRLVPQRAISGLVEDAVRERDIARQKASRWLTDWVRTQRRIPEDDAAADRKDAQAVLAAHRVRRRGHDDTFTVDATTDGTDPRTGKPRVVHTVSYGTDWEDS